MTNDVDRDTWQESAEKRLGFIVEGSFTSPVGLVLEERFEGIEELIRLSAFTLWLERRHVDSGMPECCVEGKNIRRLAILLLRNRNVNRIVVLRSQEKNQLQYTIKNIKELISNTIKNEKFEYIWTRGRFHRYGFSKEELKSAFKNITQGFDEKIYSANNLLEIREKLEQYIIDVESVLSPPTHPRSFFVSPSSLDDYVIPEVIPGQSVAPDTILRATDISTLFRLCENVLFGFGYVTKDYRDVGRWQLGQELILRLDIYSKESDKDWGKKTLDELLLEIKNFLGGIGISDSRNAYKTSEFFNRLFEPKERRRIRHEDFVERVSDDIKKETFGDSNALTILIEAEDLSIERKSKIGWSGIRCYMRPHEDYLLLSLSHDLRSIDLYDGLPVNLFFCLEYSSKFMRDLTEKLPHELKPRVRLDCLKFTIQYLHTYLDDLPVGVVRNV